MPAPTCIGPVEQLNFTRRLDAIAETQGRTRLALTITLVASLAVLVAVSNACFSWDRRFAFEEKKPGTWAREEIMSQSLRSWVDTQLISVPFMGVHISVSDVTIWGSIALYILTFYYFLCMRRENHEIGSILRHSIDADVAVRRLVYHGIRGAMVFSTTTGDDAPIANVDGRRPPDRPLFFVRPSVTAVTFLPAFTAWFAVVMDWLSMTVVLPAFREPGGTLWSRLVLAEKLHVVLGSGIGAAFGLLAVMMCARIVAYRKATRAVMEQYRKRL